MAGDVRCQTIAGDNLLLLLKTRTTQYIVLRSASLTVDRRVRSLSSHTLVSRHGQGRFLGDQGAAVPH